MNRKQVMVVTSRRPPQMKPDLIFFDFDGVLTDNRVWIFENGLEAVVCNRADGLGFSLLREAGFECMIISTETNSVVAHRAHKLQLEFMQSVKDKGEAVRAVCKERDIDLQRTAFVGNDVNDLPALALVGFSLCPSDAVPEVRRECKHILRSAGGAGVVREIAGRWRVLFK